MRKTNILYIASSGLSALSGGGWTRISGEAKVAKKHGFFVHILCFVPPHFVLLKPRFVASAKASLEKDAQSPVYFIPRLPLTRIPLIHWFNDLYSTVIILLFCSRFRAKVIHCHGIGLARLGLMARKFRRDIKVIVDVHGALTEEYMYERNLRHKDKIAKRMEKLEFLALKESDWIIFVSNSMQRYYETKFQISIKNSSIIPCATDNTLTVDLKKREKLRQENGLNGKLVFCYVGSGETYQLPGTMCQLFSNILKQFPQSFFLILSHHQDIFLKYLKINNIDSNHYKVLSVEHKQVFELLQMADIGFLLREDSIINKVSSPTKFAEYLLCGLPVIITNYVGDFSEMVKYHKLGYIVNLNNLEVSNDLINFINDVQKNRLEYIKRCSSFAKKYLSWELYENVLISIYNSLLSEC